MKLTIPGKDVIKINESNIDNYKKQTADGTKFHVIKFNFDEPTKDKIDDVIVNFPNTNRFIISDNIRLYNGYLKHVGKKYYVQNLSGAAIISFFRKNNKILCSFVCMTQAEATFLLENYLQDILDNCEIILINENDLSTYSNILKNWAGNVIVRDSDYEI